MQIDINRAYNYYKNNIGNYKLLTISEFQQLFINFLNELQKNEMFDMINNTQDIPYLLNNGKSKHISIKLILKKIK